MDRRDFLGNMAALGALGISLEASGASRMGEATNAISCIKKKAPQPLGFDENLVCIISDLHLHPDWHQEKCLAGIVDQILALNPRPRNVLCLGDIAYLTGKPEEYAAAKKYLDRLEEAGMRLTLTLGNHDRRAEFAEAFPVHAAASQLPDRYVYKVETPLADLILLDSLQEGDDKKTWINPGALDDRQVQWLEAQLSSYTDGKPVFVMAHHPLEDISVIRNLLVKSPSCKGFIYGHKHIWDAGWVRYNFMQRDILRTLCVPSTGHWGDIGFVTMAMEKDRATARLYEQEFYFPGPLKEGEEKPAIWSEIEREHKDAVCVFPY
jgi:hypothetical protein